MSATKNKQTQNLLATLQRDTIRTGYQRTLSKSADDVKVEVENANNKTVTKLLFSDMNKQEIKVTHVKGTFALQHLLFHEYLAALFNLTNAGGLTDLGAK